MEPQSLAYDCWSRKCCVQFWLPCGLENLTARCPQVRAFDEPGKESVKDSQGGWWPDDPDLDKCRNPGLVFKIQKLHFGRLGIRVIGAH